MAETMQLNCSSSDSSNGQMACRQQLRKQSITKYFRDLGDSVNADDNDVPDNKCLSKSDHHFVSLLEFLDHHYLELESNSKSVEQKKNQGETLSSGDNDGKTIGQQPILLHLGSGDGRVAVAAAHLNICSSAVGVDINPQLITASKQLAFKKKVFNKCHFFEEDLTVDPKILLDNPHWIADKMNESDVVFLHVDPKMLKKLIPLLARLSNGRKIVTLMNHLPKEASICPEFIHGTELCVYDGVIDNRDAVEQILPPPPEPVDADDIDKEFARRSIQHALPSKF